MKQKTIFLSVLCITLLLILICMTVMAEGGDGSGKGGGRNTDLSSILTGLLLLKFIIGGIAALSGLVLLKTIKINRNIRTLLMCGVFVLFGILVIIHQPCPLQALMDTITAFITGSTVTLKKTTMLIFIGGLSVIGVKMFCGWVCPFGALQEIVNRISVPSGKKVKLPFKITNGTRISIFFISLVMILTTGSNLYTYHNILNPFELFEWHFELTLTVLIGVVAIASVFVYRPFCYLVCPIGLLTWLLEYISIFRVRLDQGSCIGCNKCTLKSPCPSIKAILDSDTLRPDCFACGVCIGVCPTDALTFRIGKTGVDRSRD